jgi:hypothetical protein
MLMNKVHFDKKYLQSLVALLLVATLTACSSAPPQNTSDLCEIFRENRSWYKDAAAASEKWGMPIALPMSIMYQESSFKHNARPPMRWFIGFIPYGRGSSAYGYSQAKTVTWDEYVKEADRFWASRTDFADAIDFMGWYIDKTHRLNNVSKWDGYQQYLNYHEGWGGYRRSSYKNKAWLRTIARRVDDRAKIYSSQLKRCEKELQRGWLWRLLFS